VGGQRIALVVAVDRYQHAGLRQLIAPAADAAALAQVLGDPALGGFDVEVLHNATASVICERVEDVLTDRKQADLVLLHFSCHGLKDDAGELYLAATNTVPTRLASTGVDAALVNRLMRRSRARRVVLLLDCCYGGAFERGAIARAGRRGGRGQPVLDGRPGWRPWPRSHHCVQRDGVRVRGDDAGRILQCTPVGLHGRPRRRPHDR
jgi:uncharacterized caspase-like protein